MVSPTMQAGAPLVRNHESPGRTARPIRSGQGAHHVHQQADVFLPRESSCLEEKPRPFIPARLM